MASSGEKAFEKQLMDAGKKLLKPPSSVEELLPLLDKVESCLSRVEQSPSVSMQNALSPSMKALVTNELLRHLDMDVKVAVASCISEITRITAPDAPYDDDQMKEIFQLIVVAFEKLSDTSSRSYSKRVSILETVAKVRSCVVMLDLECDALILEMFQHFLKAIRDNHPENVLSSMETIMTLVLEESEEISSELLYPILSSVKKEKQDVLPIAKRLAEKVLENCTAKLKPYLKQAVESIGTSVHDYSKIVASICQEKLDDTKHNDGSASEEHLANQNKISEIVSDEPPQVPEELKPETPSHGEVEPTVAKSEKPVLSNGAAQSGNDDSMIGLDSPKKEQPSDVESSKIIKSETNPDHDGQETEDQKLHSSISSMEASDSCQMNSDKEAKELPEERNQSNEEANNSLPEHPVVDQASVPSDHEEETRAKLSLTAAENTGTASTASPSLNQSHTEGTQPKKGRRPKKKGSSNLDSDPGSSSVPKEALSSEKAVDVAPPSEGVISEKGSEDVISEKGSEGVISEKGSEDAISGKGSEDVPEKGSEDVPEKGSENVITEKGSEDVITEKGSEDVITEMESDEDKDIKAKSHGRSGRKVKANKTPRRADATAKESGVASDSEAKPLKRSGKKVDESNVDEDEPSLDKQESKRKRGRETDSKKDVTGELSIKVDEKNTEEDELSVEKREGRTKKGKGKNISKADVTGEPSSKVDERNADEDEPSDEKQEGRTKRGRGKSNSKKDLTGELGSKKMVSSPTSTIKSSNKDQSHLEETPKVKSKRKRTPGKAEKRTPGKDEALKLTDVEERKNVVGSTIEVWWPDDKKFYKGIIESYDPDKDTHKVAYVDGDVEILNLNEEKWKFVEKDNDPERGKETELLSPESSSEMPIKKKMKGNSDSSKAQTKANTSAKRGKGSSSVKSKGRVTKSDGKSKVEISKAAGKSKDDSASKSKDEPSKASGKLKDDAPISGSKSKGDSPSTKDDKVGKSKDRTPKASNKLKEDANQISGKSKEETTKTPVKPKGGGTPKTSNKSTANGTSAAKGKSGLSKLEESKDLSDDELLSSSSKTKESEIKSARKRPRKSRG